MLRKTGLFQLLSYGSSALYRLYKLLMADVLLRAPYLPVLENHTKNDTKNENSLITETMWKVFTEVIIQDEKAGESH